MQRGLVSEKGESVCPETFLGAANKFRGVSAQVLSFRTPLAFSNTERLILLKAPAMQAKQCLYGHPRVFVKFEIRSCHDLEPEGTTYSLKTWWVHSKLNMIEEPYSVDLTLGNKSYIIMYLAWINMTCHL